MLPFFNQKMVTEMGSRFSLSNLSICLFTFLLVSCSSIDKIFVVDSLHAVVGGAAAALGDNPVDVLRRILNVTSLAYKLNNVLEK